MRTTPIALLMLVMIPGLLAACAHGGAYASSPSVAGTLRSAALSIAGNSLGDALADAQRRGKPTDVERFRETSRARMNWSYNQSPATPRCDMLTPVRATPAGSVTRAPSTPSVARDSAVTIANTLNAMRSRDCLMVRPDAPTFGRKLFDAARERSTLFDRGTYRPGLPGGYLITRNPLQTTPPR